MNSTNLANLNPRKLTISIIGGGVGLIVALWLVFASMETVENGHRGMKVSFGKVDDELLMPGLVFVNPFTTKVVLMNIQTNKWEGESQAYTRDVQQAKILFTLNYNLDPTKVIETYQSVGPDWAGKLVGQVVHESIKREFGQHEAVDIIAQRDKASRSIEAEVKEKLALRNVNVTGFQLTNIDYTAEFEHAVEQKVIAQQKAIEEQNRTVQIREQAAQKVETAKGNAEATLLIAKAEAESIRIRANALEANAKLVEWEAVQKWNGQMPTYMMGGTVPFIQIPSK
jgi:regulator of protease activity HflC (stomatin/prohibitin superfamily)